MARSRSIIAPVALLAAACYIVLPQFAAFVTPAGVSSFSKRHLRSGVSLAATAADVQAAKKKFDLQKWAADTLAGQGSPEAAAAQARAQQAEQAYLAVKAEAEGAAPTPAAVPAPVPAPAPLAAEPAAAPVAGVPVKEEVEEAKKKAALIAWAAKTLEEKGMPQAAEMKERAARKAHEYEALKAAFENGAPAAAAPAPAAAAPAPAAVAASGVPTKEEVVEAKKKADLMTWAAQALIQKGDPKAAEMQAKADAKLQIYESLKAAFDQGVAAAPVAAAPAPAPAAPAAAPAAAAPAMPTEVPTAAELAAFKKEADLMAWAADSLSAKGAPQAAEMRAKADLKMQTYETLKALAAANR